MATDARELFNWLSRLLNNRCSSQKTIVGIDDGGLALRVEGSDAYFEVGGMPRYVCHYHCTDCENRWSAEFDSRHDDECPICGKPYTPLPDEKELPEYLEQLFKDDAWADDPHFDLAEWRDEVFQGNTQLGYRAWLENKYIELANAPF